MRLPLVLTLFASLSALSSAQPGEWAEMPDAWVGGVGGHLVWVGDSTWYEGGGSITTFGKFDPKYNSWFDTTPSGASEGSSSAWAGGQYVYRLTGGTVSFYRHGKAGGVGSLASIPESVGTGGSLCWTGGDYILAFPGGTSTSSYRYRISTNTWAGGGRLPAIPSSGACIAWVGEDSVFALRGGGTRDFWHHRGSNWVSRSPAPVDINAGAALLWNGKTGSQSKLLMAPGGGSQGLWEWDVSTAVWTQLPDVPQMVGGNQEGALATFDRRSDHQHLYATQGGNGNGFWRYGPTVTASLPFSESFEGSFFPPQGWVTAGQMNTRLRSGTNPSAVPYSGSWMYAFTLFGKPARINTNIRSLQLDIGTTRQAAVVTFRMFQSPDSGSTSAESLFVKFSTDGTHYATAASYPRYAASSGWYEKEVVVAKSLTGTFYVLFAARTGPYGSNFNIYIDSVRVWSRPYQDAAVTAVPVPGDTVPEGTLVTPQARVRNLGTTSASFKARFKIGAVYVDSQQVTGLAAGDSIDLLFSGWTAVSGSYAAKCSTALSGDEDPANNALAKTFLVTACDVGASRIVAPSGTIDSGSVATPQAMVRNFGNIAASFPVVMRIGSFHTDTMTVSNLGPGESTAVSFAQWSALQRGTHAVRCSTMLANDRQPSNNKATGSVSVRVRDVAPRRIVAPVDTVDSATVVTPRAVVRNLGTVTETFAVRMAIGAFYSNNQNVTNLAAGDSVTVSFTNWTATQKGTHVVRCSTLMSGDMVVANNLKLDTVTVIPWTGIEEPISELLPTQFALEGVLPNPFTGHTVISYAVPRSCQVDIRIYSAAGEQVGSFAEAHASAGRFRAVWNGCDRRGRQVPKGIYFCTFRADDFSETRKLVKLD